MGSRENAAATRTFFEHLNHGRVEEAIAMLSDDVEWENRTPDNVPFGGVYKGKEGFARYGLELASSIEMGELGIDELVAEDDTVVMIGAESSLVKSTGRQYTMSYVFVLRFAEDGRIQRVREFVDTAALGAAF
jgi:ketosteroid isomerase-like protein